LAAEVAGLTVVTDAWLDRLAALAEDRGDAAEAPRLRVEAECPGRVRRRSAAATGDGPLPLGAAGGPPTRPTGAHRRGAR
jgi:hypothetical protein